MDELVLERAEFQQTETVIGTLIAGDLRAKGECGGEHFCAGL